MRPQQALELIDHGYALAARGDAAGAERAYRKAIELAPNVAEAYYNLGVLLQEGGRSDEAIACYRRALTQRPTFAEAHNNLGNLLRARGRIDEACTHYAAAVRHNPGLAQARSNWSAALNDLGIDHFAHHRHEQAVESYRRALEIDPGLHHAAGNLGNALGALGRWDEARALYERAIMRDPDDADAHNNLGQLLQDRDDLAGAAAQYARALELVPTHAEARSNQGYLLEEQGRREEAMEHYRGALAANPHLARAAYNLGVAHLYRGEFSQGWELLERRYDIVPPITPRRDLKLAPFGAADWGGGHRTAIWKEQGMGDQLVFATLLPEFEGRGEDFVFEVDRRLVPAFARAHPRWKVVGPEQSAAAFADCDRQIAVASLAGLMRPDSASFARQPRSLLAADAGRASAFRAQLAVGGKQVIGISWRSFQPKVRGKLVRNKSAPLAAFAPLADHPGVRLLDLQYGDTAAERAAFEAAGHRLERLPGLDLFEDIDGVLAAVAACDLIVTTSNVTAHFAGALGKRALLVCLRGAAPFHYWAPGADGRSRWYPSVEIASLPGITTWEQAIAHVHDLLQP